MASGKTQKELVLHRHTYVHETFGMHVEEIRLSEPVCLTGIKLGPLKDGNLGNGAAPFVHIFARDLSTLGASRFACLSQNASFQKTGTTALRLQATVTDHVIVHGQYQNLPIALYGWKYVPGNGRQVAIAPLEGLTFQPHAPPLKLDLTENGIPYPEIPVEALMALQPLLHAWREVKADAWRMKARPLTADDIAAVMGVANRVGQAIGLHGKETMPFPSAGVRVKQEGQTQQDASGDECESSLEIAEMAACWASIFSGPCETAAEARYGLAGLAASVIVASCPR